jgi:hypothetical protein
MVHPLKRGQALRGRLPLPDLVCEVSQASLKSSTSGERKEQGRPETVAKVTEVNRFSPLSKAWGAAQRGRGQESNTPPPSCHLRLPCGTRETPRGMQRAVGTE